MTSTTNQLSAVNLDEVSAVANNGLQYAFTKTSKLKTLSMPKLTTATGTYCLAHMLYQSTGIEEVNLSALSSASSSYSMYYAFYQCTKLKKVYLNKLSNVGTYGLNYTFNGCTALQLVDFSQATAVPTLSNTNAFANTNSTYKIVVPDDLYSSWIAASNWSNSSIKSHIVKVSEYTYT